jgi:carbon monoxide dehydrogenase subunit G
MVEVASHVARRVRLAAPVEAAWALLKDVPRWGALYPHVASIEPYGDDAFLWRMDPLGPPGGRVSVVYACRYEADEATHTLHWTPIPGVGNAAFGGACSVEPDGEAATIGTLRMDARLQVPAPSFLAAVVRPTVSHEMERMTDTFAERLSHALDV